MRCTETHAVYYAVRFVISVMAAYVCACAHARVSVSTCTHALLAMISATKSIVSLQPIPGLLWI